MEGGGEEVETDFADYQVQTIDIGRTIPLVIVAVASFLFFLPVFILSIRPSSKKHDGDGNEIDVDEDEETSIIQKLKANKCVCDEEEQESTPLLLSRPDETVTTSVRRSSNNDPSLEYGGTGTSLQSSVNTTSSKQHHHQQQQQIKSSSDRGRRRHSLSPSRRPLRSTSSKDVKFSVPQRHSSVTFHRISSVRFDIDPRATISSNKQDNYFRRPKYNRNDDDNDDDNDEGEQDEEVHLNAIKFSDPKTTASEKFRIITCHNCDSLTMGMIGLALPYLTQAFITAVSELIQVAIVGHQLGSSTLSIYIVIDLFIKLTTDIVGSIIISGNTMISQIAESDHGRSPYKIGTYLQLSIVFYVIGFLPLLVFWSFCTKDILLYLGNDPSFAELGQQFAIPYTFSVLVEGIVAGFQYTLDVVGYEVQSTVLTFFGELGKTLAVVIGMCWHSRFPDMTLVDLGYLYLILELIYFAAVMITIYSYGWLEKYYEGFFSICKKNTDESNTSQSSVNSSSNVNMVAIKFMLYNAMISSLSNLLMQGEWQVMIFYASSLGPAEVAAWGILGIIWEELEYIVTAVAEGCAVRCTLSLGAGDVRTAKLVAYKSLWICFVWGAVVTAIFVTFDTDIPRLFTDDPVLQKIVSDNLPLISAANLVAGIAVMAEHVLWGQNRYAMGTGIGCLTTGFVTLPLGALSSMVFNFDLRGQTTAITIGCAAFGAMAMFALICSDWEKIAEDVILLHGNDSSSSDSSGGSDSSSSLGGMLLHDYEWEELTIKKRNAAESLGYNEELWKYDRETSTSNQNWNDLSSKQQQAASILGYDKIKWNDDNNDHHHETEIDQRDLSILTVTTL